MTTGKRKRNISIAEAFENGARARLLKNAKTTPAAQSTHFFDEHDEHSSLSDGFMNRFRSFLESDGIVGGESVDQENPTFSQPSTTLSHIQRQSTNDTEVQSQASESGRKRALQNVLPHHVRIWIVKWMIHSADQIVQKGVCARAARQFPQYFRRTEKANLQRASCYWKSRCKILESYKPMRRSNMHAFEAVTGEGVKRHNLKVLRVRGRLQSEWSKGLYSELREEFERLRKAGVRFSDKPVLQLARQIVLSNRSEYFNSETPDAHSGRPIIDHLQNRWVRHFLEKIGS